MLLRARCRTCEVMLGAWVTPMSLRLHASQYRLPERTSTRAEQTWRQASEQLWGCPTAQLLRLGPPCPYSQGTAGCCLGTAPAWAPRDC